tara:strand:- start:25670 stop:26413 length:744 start_codon:yes stop_codon:yes gene_type:complete
MNLTKNEMDYRLPLIDRERKVIMDWSPKAGCTIVIKMFYKRMDLLETALQTDEWVHEYRMFHFFKNNPTQKEDFQNPEFYKLKVVRNPYSRVVSSYLHTIRNNSMHQPVKKVLRRWSANITFKKYLDFLEKIDLREADPHYAFQVKHFEEQGFKYDKIVKLENLHQGIQEINLEKGIGYDLSGISSPHHVDKNESLTMEAFNKRYSKIKDNVPAYNNFYNEELIEQVRSIYKLDLEMYNYEEVGLTS